MTLCTDCGAVCEDCALTCAACGVCERCAEFCGDCGLCESCCEAVSEGYGCDHGICVESEAWKTHYCTVGGHCITELGAIGYDDTHHWNWCGEGCPAKINVREHVFTAAITRQPTTTEPGILTYSCDCGYSKTESIPVVTEEGYTHSCIPTVTPATCTSGGYTTYTCACGYSYRSDETPPLAHAYAYEKDDSGHWLKCQGCADTKLAEAHKYGVWTVTKAASYTEPGTKQRTCLICGYVEEVVIPILAHDGQYVITLEGETTEQLLTVGKEHRVPELPTQPPKAQGNRFDGWVEKGTDIPVRAGDILTGDIVLVPVWLDCGDGNHTDANQDEICDDCGKKLEHIHSYGSEWKLDQKNHWKECSCGAVSDLAAHVDSDQNGLCDACGYKMPKPADKPEDDSWYWIWIALINQEFKITATTSAGGSVTPSGVSTVKYEQDLSYAIVPHEGYEISAVYVDGENVGAVSSYTFQKVTKDHSISAEFKKLPWENPYVDVSESDWNYSDVEYVTEKGLMNGIGENRFAPEISTDRAMLVTILWRLEGCPITDSPMLFTDVADGMWYTEAIRWAYDHQIVKGYGDDTFGPTDAITREQAAAILHRYATYKGWECEATIPMPPSYIYSEWAENDVCFANGIGLFDDIGADIENLTAVASRGELAAYLRRFCMTFIEKK